MVKDNKIAVFLGAGFSHWAARLPLVRSLFDFKIDALNEREQRWLKKAKKLKAEWDKSHPSVNPEQFIEYILLNGSTRQRTYLSWYITRRLSDPFIANILGGMQTLMIDDSRRKRVRGITKATKFLWHIKQHPLSGILTSNYDLLIEYSLGTADFNYGVPGERLEGRGKNPFFPEQGYGPSLRGAIPIAKVHGSLSWAEDGTRFTDGRCGLKGKAHIVPPIHKKIRSPELETTWKLAEDILASSTAILVFGFAFNPYDQALLELLRSGRNIKNVLLIDPFPNVSAAHIIWPTAKIITCSPPSSRNWNKIKLWISLQAKDSSS